MVQVRRIPLIEREIREHLSRAALDALFASAEIISEGEANQAQGKTQFLGSTMLTLDMPALAELLCEPADEGTARRLAALLAKDKSLDGRIESIVRREVERRILVRREEIRIWCELLLPISPMLRILAPGHLCGEYEYCRRRFPSHLTQDHRRAPELFRVEKQEAANLPEKAM